MEFDAAGRKMTLQIYRVAGSMDPDRPHDAGERG
jgi:hypothetical protein